MINPHELRIGNLVKPGPEHMPPFDVEKYCEVTQVYKEGFTVDYHYPSQWFEEIPLTPELLEKCGFVTHEEGKLLKINEQLFLYYGQLEKIIRLCFFEIDFSYPIYLRRPVYHFQYLHQLQNLYFALTGEELPVKL